MRPPDLSNPVLWDKNALIEPKYIIISRKDNQSFENVSPFIIKKVIDFQCGGEVESVKKTRDGKLLVKTKGLIQAQRLLRLTQFHNFLVSSSEHKTLNTLKGVIYSNDLRNIEKEDILKELSSQKVIEVEKIFQFKNNLLQESPPTGIWSDNLNNNDRI